MMGRLQFVLVVIAKMAMLSQAFSCDFPIFMQTNGTQRDWRMRIREQYTNFSLQIIVEKNLMRTVSTDMNSTMNTRVCLQGYGDNKFLVALGESGQQRNRYTCVQFLARTPKLVQVKEAPVSEKRDRALCGDDAMQLNHWLIIDKTPTGWEEAICALQGGFSIRIFDKVRHQDICDSYQGETRMESECVNGDGLLFYFRHQHCVPEDLKMYRTQRTICLANWKEGIHNFMLLRHDRFQYMWILRYPVSLGASFVAYVFKDLVADTGDQIKETSNYLRLDAVRDTPRPVGSLCVDDYEVCSVWREPCSSSPAMAMTCPRTCGICNASRPVVCRFDDQFRGNWYDAAHLNVLALTVNTSTMEVRNEVRERFHCVRWDHPGDKGARFATDEMLVTEFFNGCRPRYTCVRFLQKSSSVMFMKLSESLTWPFTQTPQETVDCSKFNFEHDENSVLPNRFRHKYFKLLYSKNSNHPVQCGLPEDMRNYNVTFKDGTDCLSTVTETYNKQEIVLNLANCSTNPLGSTTFTCLESSKLLPATDMLVVTRTSRQPYQIHCWVFPKRPRTTFYVLAGAQCNEAARRRMRKGRLIPFAFFSKNRRSSVSETAKQPKGANYLTTTLPSQPHISDKEEAEETGSEYAKNRTTFSGNSTEATDDEINPSPFVIIAAVIFFAVFQIPCLCKSS